MFRRRILISLILIISCILLWSVQGQIIVSTSKPLTPNRLELFGSKELLEAQKGTNAQSAEQPVLDGRSRVHQFYSEVLLLLRDNPAPFLNAYYFSLVQERENQELCKRNRFKKCYLAIGHGYQKPSFSSEQLKSNPPTTVAAYFGYNQDNDFSIAFEEAIGDTWRPLLIRAAERANPFNEALNETDCNKEIEIPDLETIKSEYTQTLVRHKKFPHLISTQTEFYDFELKTEASNVNAEINSQGQLKPEQVLKQYQNEVKLGGKATFSIRKLGNSKDILSQNLSGYRRRLEGAKFQSKSSIQRDTQRAAQIKADPDTGVDPDFSQLDILQDERGAGAIDFAKYFKGTGDFQKDYCDLIKNQQTRLLTIEQPERLLEQSNGQVQRLLPVIATHTIYEYTKILYSKTILGKTIEVKYYGKCQLIISVSPSKHQIYCFGQIQYKVFSYTQTKTIFSFTKLIATNWSWGQNWGGSWGFSFAVPLPPPVSFITINFYVNVDYSINLNLYSTVTQWWYPLIHEVKAIASTQLKADATATLKVIAVEGGVFIAGTIVKVSTDPTCTLYYYLQQQHKFILFWVKWYWCILAFQFEWGFKWRYWFFGWKPWQTIAKWTIFNGITQKYLILNKIFWIHY